MDGYAAHCVIAFASGGWLIAKLSRNPWVGALLLGGIGLTSGIFMALAVYPGVVNILMVMAVTAAAYGAVGGQLLGYVLRIQG